MAHNKSRRDKIPKKELAKFVRRGKTNRALSRYSKVSLSTVKRRIRRYKLTGIWPRGRRPIAKRRPRFPKSVSEWVDVKEYFDKLDRRYHFVQPRYPPHKYIYPKTMVCSFRKSNPKGKFTTVGIYFIVLESAVYFLYYTRIRYSEKPVNFKEIYRWISQRVNETLGELYARASFSIERPIALTFLVE